ncbi:helix-turn-helix transcriptional regulator [Kutzneria sp. NPDC051319]|uniref:helix-turn-helix domain-containing protein n=1 Tax=Kutzneria sp. NPDC051319 TaxID=3155047 RepID=UPI00342718B9
MEPIEVLPVDVRTRVFAARPGAVPEIREFIRQCAADAPLAEADGREVSNAVFRAMLDAAGPSGAIQISCRTYPDYVEFDVLRTVAEPVPVQGTFADWITDVLRREGISRETAARQLGVSAKTVSRWAGGETEPRLRELRRIQERFGEVDLR